MRLTPKHNLNITILIIVHRRGRLLHYYYRIKLLCTLIPPLWPILIVIAPSSIDITLVHMKLLINLVGFVL